MSIVGRNIGAAFRSLSEQKNRAVLSATGIMVGTTAIVLLVSIAFGVKQDVSAQVRDLGVNVLVVVPGRLDEGTFNPNFGGMSYLKEDDATALRSVPGVVRAEPFTFIGGGIRNGPKVATPLLAACTPGWFAMRPVQMQEGATFGESQVHQDVMVLGSIAKKQLFGTRPAVGQWVEMNQRRYRVIGVTQDAEQEKSLFSFGSLQNMVYVPYPRLKELQSDFQTARVMIQIRQDAEPRALIRAMDKVLERRLDRQQFQILTQEDLLGLVYKLMGILTWLLTGLTSIALFVGGVGIMTVMLMSVNERAKEIGIRKTVGARRVDVFVQFLAEAVALSLLGSAAGLAFSYVADLGLTKFTPIKPLITPSTVFLAFGVSLLVGGVFGLIPAMNAAGQDPVTALRNE